MEPKNRQPTILVKAGYAYCCGGTADSQIVTEEAYLDNTVRIRYSIFEQPLWILF
jgi:hypothetical protein